MPKYDFSTVVSSTTATTILKTATFESWVGREYVSPPEDHGIYQLIGRVTAEWARLDHALDRIIWTLAGLLYQEGGCITSQLMGATSRYRVIIAQLSLRATHDAAFTTFVERVDKLMRQSYDPQEERNRIIHDTWYLDAEKKTPGQFRSWPHKDPQFGVHQVDSEKIEKTIEAATNLALAAENILQQITLLAQRPKA